MMAKKIIHKLKSETGQAVVELAITLPILIMLLCGIIDFGWYFTNRNVVDNCARTGGRYAVVNTSGLNAIQNITDYTRSLAPDNMADDLVINVTFSNPTNPKIGNVTVEVLYNLEVLTPIADVFLPGETIALNSKCVMKAEQ